MSDRLQRMWFRHNTEILFQEIYYSNGTGLFVAQIYNKKCTNKSLQTEMYKQKSEDVKW